MQGIHVINDPNGTPAVLTIDLNNLDPDVKALVAEILTKVEQQAEATERAEWLAFASTQLNRAYGDDEPDYTVDDPKWINPDYSPK